MRGEQVVAEVSQTSKVEPVGSQPHIFEVVPKEPGMYRLVAELLRANGRPVRSWRDVTVRGRPATGQ